MKKFTAWALRSPRLEASGHAAPAILGWGCWMLGPQYQSIPMRLFRTRNHARLSKFECCYSDARPIKVIVTVEPA